ncbi:MAG: DUF255 domain-containing protein [Armatimonadota bacterium]|nr:DUF255 domain-containing protein [Armatimonadota bacterium]
MFWRSPKYAVTTFALVVIAVAAFGLKFAAKFLPDRRPNDLAGGYGEYLLRSSRQDVDWTLLERTSFDRAGEQDKTVLLDIGSTMSLSAKRFSEDYATDDEYERLLHDHFVAVKVDALEMPWLVDALSLETPPLGQSEGFILAAMNPAGGVIEVTALRPRAGDESLLVWLERIAKLRYSNRSRLEAQADASLANREATAASLLSRGPAGIDDIADWSRNWERLAIQRTFANARLSVSTLPFEVLLGSTDTRVWGQGLSLMLGMAESPCYDVVQGGFFVSAGAGQWGSPTTAKLTGHSLQVAAFYAEAAVRFDLPLFRWLAAETARWSLKMRAGGLFITGSSSDQDQSDVSPYYSFDRVELEGKPLHLDDYALASMSTRSSFPSSVAADYTESVAKAATELRRLRVARRAPRTDATTYANLNGQSISGLFRIGKALGDKDLVSEAKSAFLAAAAMFVQPIGDVLHATMVGGRTTGYCGDYAWMARAAIDGYAATGDAALLLAAERITERMIEVFLTESGAMASYLPSLLDFIGYDFPVCLDGDTELRGVNAVAATNLADISAVTGKAEFRERAVEILRAFAGRYSTNLAPAGFVLAGRRIYGPTVLVQGFSIEEDFGVPAFNAPTGRFRKPGLYLAQLGRVEGPLAPGEIRARLSRR